LEHYSNKRSIGSCDVRYRFDGKDGTNGKVIIRKCFYMPLHGNKEKEGKDCHA
jgi:hypothetical protein